MRVRCSLFVVRWLFVVRCSLSGVRVSLFVVVYWLAFGCRSFLVCRLLLAVCCSSFAHFVLKCCCLLRVVCSVVVGCSLYDACCVLVVRCSSCVVEGLLLVVGC